MSFILKSEAPSGVVGKYWRIKEIVLDIVSQNSAVLVCQYLDAQAFAGKKTPLQEKLFRFDGDDFPFTDEAIAKASVVVLAYKKLMGLDQFKGAKDVE